MKKWGVCLMKSAIIYYSLDGNARCAAEAIAHKWAADIIELTEVKPRKRGPFGFIMSAFQAARGKKSKLSVDIAEMAKPYEKIYIISPVWASRPVPAVNTCLHECDFSGKQVGILSIQADPRLDGADRVLDTMARCVEAKKGQIVFRHGLVGASPGNTMSREDMERQINEIFDDVR